MKIREGNDFTFIWAITRNDIPEDLTKVTDIVVTASIFGKKIILPYEIIDTDTDKNKLRLEINKETTNILGYYNLKLTYNLSDPSFSDAERSCAVDIDAFERVAKTAQADTGTEFSITSDMAIGFKGDKGDSAYQVWLDEGNVGTIDDYFDFLQQPATDAAISVGEVESTVSGNEDLRVTAEQGRVTAEQSRQTAEELRDANETARISNETLRVENETARNNSEELRVSAETTRAENESARITAENTRNDNETNRVTAEGLRVTAEDLRQTNTSEAIQNAETATNEANTARDLATEVANNPDKIVDDYWWKYNPATKVYENTNIRAKGDAGAGATVVQTTGSSLDDVMSQKAVTDEIIQLESDVSNDTEKASATTLAELNARLIALERIVSSRLRDRLEVVKEFNVWGKTNLILYGVGASTKAPDFIGQTYIDTTAKNIYIATGTSSSANWKLV